MAEDDGLLSQDDINAALNDAGLTPEAGDEDAGAGASDAAGGDLSQDDIDAAMAEAGQEASAAQGEADDAAPSQEAPGQEERVDSAGRPFDEVAAAMAAAIEGESEASSGNVTPPGQAEAAQAYDIPAIDQAGKSSYAGESNSIELLRDVDLNVKIELGRSRMLVDDVLRLGEGSVVELDKLAGDPVDVLVNDRLVARGEVLVLNDNFCVRINDIVSKNVIDEAV
jgi:flagellar motor switch protein FliN/FliY